MQRANAMATNPGREDARKGIMGTVSRMEEHAGRVGRQGSGYDVGLQLSPKQL